MPAPHIDLLSILIAAIVNIIIGFLWYSRYLFGIGSDPSAPPRRLAILWTILVAFLTAYVLGFFEVFLGVTTVTDGMFVGFVVWIGFIATTQISAVIWGKMTFKRFLVHTGCELLTFLAMGGIIGA
ncbi:MAG: hypothetical protein HW387_17 [Parachlamydiales bacterium]|nr:hypothetical protein [Parachlamydiales bacterium]